MPAVTRRRVDVVNGALSADAPQGTMSLSGVAVPDSMETAGSWVVRARAWR